MQHDKSGELQSQADAGARLGACARLHDVNGLSRVVRRNTILLATVTAVNSAVLQLVAAVSTLTFVLVTGREGLLGIGPAIFLTSSGLTAIVAGHAMDRFGRRPVIAVGIACGSAGCALNAFATSRSSLPALLTGFVLIGAGMATSLLIRTAAGDMYPAERRARGISYVLSGSVLGAVLGPAVFSPLFAHQKVSAGVLTVPWLVAAGIGLVAAALVMAVRPDPRTIAELLSPKDAAEAGPAAAPLAEIIRRPGVIPAMLASMASFAVMVSVMNLTGYVVVVQHHHSQDSVFPIVGAHVLGMYALVLVVGALIDRIGRTPALAGGLVVMAVSTLGIQWWTSVPATALLLFGLGIGWNLSFVAATAQLADRSRATERGKLLGLNDLMGALLGATMALVGGYGLETSGVAALAVGAAAIALSPIAWILWLQPPAEPAAEAGGGQ
jgi:MFS family permease